MTRVPRKVDGSGRRAEHSAHTGRADRHFRTAGLKQDLRRQSVRAGAAAFSGQVTITLLNLAATMVLARILTPEAFGLLAMVMVLIGFTRMLRDLGLSTATIQREDVDHTQVSTLFWVNFGSSTLLTLLIMAAAPLVVWFYAEPRLLGITLALSALAFLDGLSIQHQALLRRQLRLGALAIIDIASLIGGIAIAISMARAGLGFWALVAMPLTQMAMKTILVWLALEHIIRKHCC
jgi:PST family polysaccharide transporter